MRTVGLILSLAAVVLSAYVYGREVEREAWMKKECLCDCGMKVKDSEVFANFPPPPMKFRKIEP